MLGRVSRRKEKNGRKKSLWRRTFFPVDTFARGIMRVRAPPVRKRYVTWYFAMVASMLYFCLTVLPPVMAFVMRDNRMANLFWKRPDATGIPYTIESIPRFERMGLREFRECDTDEKVVRLLATNLDLIPLRFMNFYAPVLALSFHISLLPCQSLFVLIFFVLTKLALATFLFL